MFLFHLLQDAADTGMGILYIVHRVIIGMFRCQSQVKVKLTVHAAHDEEIACSICSDFFNKLIECDGLARPLAHLDQFAIAIEADHLKDENLQMAWIVPQGFHGRFHAGDIAVMIGSP